MRHFQVQSTLATFKQAKGHIYGSVLLQLEASPIELLATADLSPSADELRTPPTPTIRPFNAITCWC